jgi:hemoglobin/transferrin/lactoferrin receptor protein
MRFPFRVVCVHLLFAAAITPLYGHAQTDAAPQALTSAISVTATRMPREVDSIAGTVTVKDSAEIQKELAGDIADLIRYEPGISVSNAPSRFGLAGFNIRGVDGNRVLIRVDDVRMSDSFQIGSFSDARRNLIDLDALKSVEIVRGAASALYGSDAIGGVVSFITKDPLDYLQPGQHVYVSAKSGYESDNEGMVIGSTVALGNETLSGLVTLTRRKGHERENEGDVGTIDRSRTKPNPQDSQLDAAHARIVWQPSDRHTLRLTLNSDRSDVDTEVFSSVGQSGTGAMAINTLSMTGDDQQDRDRISLTHEWQTNVALADSLRWQVYGQQTNIDQQTIEHRYSMAAGPSAEVERNRHFGFEQTMAGVELVAHRSLSTGRAGHHITYGVDALRTRTEQLRNGVQTNLASGAQTSTILPDVFPVRDFPKTDTDQLAIFAQDEIVLGEETWIFTPGVRIDRYSLDPKPDAIFVADNPGVEVSEIDETSVSPKLGVVWDFGERDQLSTYAQYARGFRAPPYNDVNIGFTNLAFGYTAIANPDLKPETSDGFEIGLRGSYAAAHFSLAAFHNEYDDFIESISFVGSIDGLQVFQSQNIAEARIRGIELRSGLDLGALADRLDGWALNLTAAYAEGDDLVSDVPLNSVDPLKGVLGIAYSPAGDSWGVELAATAVERKSRIDESAGPQFVPPGYVTLDLLGHVNLGDNIKVNAGIFNITDKKYWQWSDVRSLTSVEPVIDRYSQPGINGAVHAVIRF